ncbi:MAG: leucine-rich repeat domain-containing protein [Erysipelotrichaceae bacterium]|jgi:hypothetical protein|nr:leucine-rich repeat domain-containing protein [Erysipelotrichaceae bacterium]
MSKKLFFTTVSFAATLVLVSVVANIPVVRSFLTGPLTLEVYNEKKELVHETTVRYGSSYKIPQVYYDSLPKTYVETIYFNTLKGWDQDLTMIKRPLKVFPLYEAKEMLEIRYDKVYFDIQGFKEEYQNNYEITKLVIPGTITHEGTNKRLATVKTNAFLDNPFLEHIEFLPFQKEAEYRKVIIESKAFIKMARLKTIIFSENVKDLGHQAIINNLLLEKIVFKATSFESIGHEVFSNLPALKEIVLPSDIEAISNNMFYKCSSLTNIGYLRKLLRLSYSIFNLCEKMEWFIIPSGVTFEQPTKVFLGSPSSLVLFVVENDDVRNLSSDWNKNGINNLRCYYEGEWYFDEALQAPVPK